MIGRKKDDETSDDNAKANEVRDDTTRKRVFGFRTVHVFDVSQTEGNDLPSFAEPSGDPGEYVQQIRRQIQSLGIELVEERIPGGALGMSEGGRITIQPDLTPAQTAATLIHELGHEKLHRSERRQETNQLIRETEAEAVAFAVCQRLGIDSNSSSSDYIRLYGGSSETLQDSLEHIRNCTAEILDGLLTDNAANTPNNAPKPKRIQQTLF